MPKTAIIQVRTDHAIKKLVERAAKKRGLSLTAYVVSGMVQLARYDLGIVDGPKTFALLDEAARAGRKR